MGSSEPPSWLPLFNAALIVVSGVFLLGGVFFIRRKLVPYHRASMLTALVFAALFLVVYVTRALLFEAKFFAGDGVVRAIYLAILGSHTMLAIVVGPLALLTLARALRRQFNVHRRLARITVPIWLYVVVTGWTIYMMLYTVG